MTTWPDCTRCGKTTGGPKVSDICRREEDVRRLSLSDGELRARILALLPDICSDSILDQPRHDLESQIADLEACVFDCCSCADEAAEDVERATRPLDE